MERFQLNQRPVATKVEPATARRCMQCGEKLDAQRISQLPARAENVMCADCAFDTLPCTD